MARIKCDLILVFTHWTDCNQVLDSGHYTVAAATQRTALLTIKAHKTTHYRQHSIKKHLFYKRHHISDIPLQLHKSNLW